MKLGKQTLQPAHIHYITATGDRLPVLGTFGAKASLDNPKQVGEIILNVSLLPHLNLLGQTAIHLVGIDTCALVQPGGNTCKDDVQAILEESQHSQALSKVCKQLCMEFLELFKPELSCAKDYKLEVAFKLDTTMVFCKPPTIPFTILEDLHTAYDASIKQGVWVPTQFKQYGTPVMPVKKTLLPGQQKAKL